MDIFESFNDIDISSDAFEELPLTDIELQKLKTDVHKKIRHKKRFKKFGAVAAILAVIVFVSAAKTTTLADNIKILSSAFHKTFAGTVYKNIDNYTQAVNQTANSKNADLSITGVIIDGPVLQIGCKVQSNDLKANRYLLNSDSHFFVIISDEHNNTLYNAGGYLAGLYKSDSNGTYEGIASLQIDNNCTLPSKVNIDIRFDTLANKNGNWHFNFDYSYDAISSKIKNYDLNKTISYFDSKITLDKLTITPLSTSLTYHDERGKDEQHAQIEFILTDENGKEIPRVFGSSRSTGSEGTGYINYDTNSNSKIKKIYITPKLTLVDLATHTGKSSLLENQKIELPINN